MPSYEVVKACYVPFGRGVRYRTPGQVVTLDVDEAENLDGYVRPTQENVRKPDATVIVRNPESTQTVRKPDTSDAEAKAGAIMGEEVTSHVSDTQADHE